MRNRWLFHCCCVLMNEGLRSEQESSFSALVVRRLSLSFVLDLVIDLSGIFSPELIFLLSKEPFWIEMVKSIYFALFSWSLIVEKFTCLCTLDFFFFCVSWALEYETWRSFYGFYAELWERGTSRFRELWLGALNVLPYSFSTDSSVFFVKPSSLTFSSSCLSLFVHDRLCDNVFLSSHEPEIIELSDFERPMRLGLFAVWGLLVPVHAMVLDFLISSIYIFSL